MLDLLLGGSPGAGALQQLPYPPCGVCIQLRVSQGRFQTSPVIRLRTLRSFRDQQRALALGQVRGHGLAGRGGVTEHAQQVVGQLEGTAQRIAEGMEPGQQLRVSPREERAELQGPGHRVPARLERRDLERELAVGGPCRRGVQVQCLADHDLLAQDREPSEGGQEDVVGDLTGQEQRVSLDEGEIAEEDRDGAAVGIRVTAPRLGPVPQREGVVDAGTTAPRRRLVDHVVVEQCAGVQQFQGERGSFDGVELASSRRLEAEQEQRRPDPFATGHEGAQLGCQGCHARMEPLDARQRDVQCRSQCRVDPVTQLGQDSRLTRRCGGRLVRPGGTADRALLLAGASPYRSPSTARLRWSRQARHEEAVALSRPPSLPSVDRPWLRSYPPGVPASYRIPKVPIPRLLDDAVRDFPQAVAVRRGHLDLTHVALRDHVADLVTLFRELGVARGDRLLVATGTTVTTPVVLLAAWRLGAIVVALPPGSDRDRIAARAVEVGEATGVIGVLATRDRLQDLLAAGLEVDWALDSTDEAWLAPPTRFHLPKLRLPRRRAADGPIRELGTAMAEVASAPVTLHGDGPVPVEAPALLVPRWRGDDRRVIVLTHANLVASTFQARLWVPDIQAGREHVVVAGDLLALGPMVLGWLAGMLAGACVELVPPTETAGLARTIARQRATLAVLAPAHVAALLSESEGSRHDLSSLRVVLASGGPLDPVSALELERRTGGARVREGFGVSEAGPITHAQPVYGRTMPGAMGLPVTDTVAIVVDPQEHGRLRAPGEPGLLLLAGPQVSPGYWRDEAATAERFVDGWLLTEDLASVDTDGVFTHHGRRHEVLTLSDGSLVAPRRVEVMLERHPAVVRAGVTCDPSDGEVVALVRCQRRHRPSEEELLTYAREHLDPRSAPERVVLVDEIPETEAGGVERAALRDLLVER